GTLARSSNWGRRPLPGAPGDRGTGPPATGRVRRRPLSRQSGGIRNTPPSVKRKPRARVRDFPATAECGSPAPSDRPPVRVRVRQASRPADERPPAPAQESASSRLELRRGSAPRRRAISAAREIKRCQRRDLTTLKMQVAEAAESTVLLRRPPPRAV